MMNLPYRFSSQTSGRIAFDESRKTCEQCSDGRCCALWQFSKKFIDLRDSQVRQSRMGIPRRYFVFTNCLWRRSTTRCFLIGLRRVRSVVVHAQIHRWERVTGGQWLSVRWRRRDRGHADDIWSSKVWCINIGCKVGATWAAYDFFELSEFLLQLQNFKLLLMVTLLQTHIFFLKILLLITILVRSLVCWSLPVLSITGSVIISLFVGLCVLVILQQF